MLKSLLASLVCLWLNNIFHSLTTPLGFRISYCFINVSGHTHSLHPRFKKKRQRDTSHKPIHQPAQCPFCLHTLILRPYISLRTAQTSESNLSAKTVIHAGSKNQSLATNALLLILSGFFVSILLFCTGRRVSWSAQNLSSIRDSSGLSVHDNSSGWLTSVLWIWQGHLRSWPHFSLPSALRNDRR